MTWRCMTITYVTQPEAPYIIRLGICCSSSAYSLLLAAQTVHTIQHKHCCDMLRERNEWVFEAERTVVCKWESRGFFGLMVKLRTKMQVEWDMEPNVTALNRIRDLLLWIASVYSHTLMVMAMAMATMWWAHAHLYLYS